MACQWPPKKGAAFTLYFTLYKNDGTVIVNPGTLTRAVSIDGAAVDTTPANAVTEEDTTYGQLSWVLSTDEMNGDAIWVYCRDDTSGCVPFTCTLYTAANTQDELGTSIASILADTGTDGVVLANDCITAAKIADNAIAAEHIADDAIVAANIATGAFTADAFAADALVAATFATDCITDDAIATGAIASTAFAAGAINAAAVADGAIDAATFAAGAIDAAAIADNAIDAGAIAADAITAAKIAAGAIDNATFAADVGSTAYATNVIALAADKAITNAALATAAALDTVDNYLDTELAAITAAVITNAAGTDIAADIIALKTVADTIQADTDLLDDAAGGIADIHTDLGTLATAVADLPTNSELATALASADDAVLTAVDAVPTAAEIKTAIEAAGSSLASILADTAMIEKWIIDKMVATDNGDGTITYVLYDTDGTTPLYTWVETTATGTRAAAT
jgi:hypothetical protein